MSTPAPDGRRAGNQPGGAEPAEGRGRTEPSAVPAAILLGLAAVLIVVVLVKPSMPQWMKVAVALLAVAVVVALLVYAAVLFRSNVKRGRR